MGDTDESKKETHILMVAFSAQGHINPMLRLAKRLISKGIHVTLTITEFTRHRMLKSSTITATTNSISNIQLLFFSDGLELDYDRGKNLDHYLESLGKFGPINVSSLIKEYYPITGHKKLHCIINNPFVPWVADVAMEHGIPCAMLWIQPCSLYAIYYRFYNNLKTFPTLTNPEMNVELPGLPVLNTEDLPSFVLPTNPFGSIPKMFNDFFTSMKKYKWVLGNSFYELEKDAIESMSELSPILPIGPLVPPTLLGENEAEDTGVEMWKAEDACLEFLDKHGPSSVIYVSFGSISVLSGKQMEAIATALTNSRKPFIWVVKPPDVPKNDGSGKVPDGFLEETKNQGIVVTWSPQIKVLSHPSLLCFITHCGWNSILETIVAGVPVIAYPQWTDQPANAKLIVDVFRIGLRLRPNKEDGIVGHDQIEKCIITVTDGPKSEELKLNAKGLKQAARLAAAAGGSSDQNIQTLVNEIFKSRGSSKDSYGVESGSTLLE